VDAVKRAESFVITGLQAHECRGHVDSQVASAPVTLSSTPHGDFNSSACGPSKCSISLLPIGHWPQVAPMTDQSPCIVGIGLWLALWGVTSALFIFYCSFACLSYLSAGTQYDRL